MYVNVRKALVPLLFLCHLLFLEGTKFSSLFSTIHRLNLWPHKTNRMSHEDTYAHALFFTSTNLLIVCGMSLECAALLSRDYVDDLFRCCCYCSLPTATLFFASLSCLSIHAIAACALSRPPRSHVTALVVPFFSYCVSLRDAVNPHTLEPFAVSLFLILF